MLLVIRKLSVSNIKPIGSYELFKQNGITYYVEAVTEEYHKEKLLVNKQMIKTGEYYIT